MGAAALGLGILGVGSGPALRVLGKGGPLCAAARKATGG